MNVFLIRPRPRLLVVLGLLLGAGLAGWAHCRGRNAPDDARPIPPEIRQLLEPYFPALILRSVRFEISRETARDAGDGAGSAAHAAETRAMTLCGVVIFRDAEAARDPGLWAHHLAHATRCARRGDTLPTNGADLSQFLEEEADRHAAFVVERLRERYRYF